MRVLATAAVLLLLPPVVPATTLTWEPAHHLAPQGPTHYPIASDFDGDGDLDISNLAINPVRHYRNIGTPQEPSWELSPGLFENLWMCTTRCGDLADLDDDGDMDAVLTCWGGQFRLQWNEGTPLEPLWGRIDTIPHGHAHPVPDLVDFDSDGDQDLMLTTSTFYASWVRNEGTAQTPVWGDWMTLFETDPHLGSGACVRYGDLDLDGDLDAVGVSMETWPYCWENVGSVGDPQFVGNLGMLTGVEYEHKGWTYGLELLDIDADGDLDLLIDQYYYGQNLLFLNQHYTSMESESWGSIKALFR